MKIPAIKATLGNNTYYIATLTFQQVSDFVSDIDDELHKSETLKDLIQRSITNNYISIKDYILVQKERFFNSLILAVYNDYPNWRGIEFHYGDIVTNQMGILEFDKEHKIFPVDGQHRVKGIKEAIKVSPELGNEQISVLFIGHSTRSDGMEKTRRIFSTLNRYAKPVNDDDIIALDEDDLCAITTRELIETFSLFQGKKIAISKYGNKKIEEKDNESLTSIITLYQCNKILFGNFIKNRTFNDSIWSRVEKKEYLKFRPSEEIINEFILYCKDYWDAFKLNIDSIKDFNKSKEEGSAKKYRNRENGGILLFRPIGLLPFVEATVKIQQKAKISYGEILKKINNIDLTISKNPWINIVWKLREKRMVMGKKTVIKNLVIYMYNPDFLTKTQLAALKKSYASENQIEEIETSLKDIPTLNS